MAIVMTGSHLCSDAEEDSLNLLIEHSPIYITDLTSCRTFSMQKQTVFDQWIDRSIRGVPHGSVYCSVLRAIQTYRSA